MLDQAAAVRTAVLYFELMLAAALWLRRPHAPRAFAACLISSLWVTPSLLVLQQLNQSAGWWTFTPAASQLKGMPLDLYFAWIVFWGILPTLACPKLKIGWAVSVLLLLDLAVMPLCSRIVALNPNWLIGEGLAATLVLLPALCLARWTLDDVNLNYRAALQLWAAAMLFLYLVPEIVFALKPGMGWRPLLAMPGWAFQLAVQGMAVVALPGLNAVIEFAVCGGGTPIPYDPPKRLVASGAYRYCANPMQMTCAAAMLAWAALLQNPWMAGAAAISVVYSAGIAEWDERQDLSKRFGKRWEAYRAEVRPWRVRWRPYCSNPVPVVYIAATCEPCRELRSWIECRKPIGIKIIDAESFAPGSIRRMRYEPGDGSQPDEGVRALGRVLEHCNFAWALAGMALRLPLIWQGAQLCLDASGLGPRTVAWRAPGQLPQTACKIKHFK